MSVVQFALESMNIMNKSELINIPALLAHIQAQDEGIERLKVLLAEAIGPENMINDIQYPD